MYEKQSRNTNRSTDTIASFLLKTYEILQHPEYQCIISWEKSGVGFIIHDVVLFTREILPKYFRHSNFSSFVRQLNMYDFHKVKQQNDILVFKNPLFCKGQQQNLKFIRRKAAKKITGQKRTHLSQKNDMENEKYQNMLKGFKKTFEAEINQSSVFYEKSLEVIKELNDSNLRKKLYLKDIFGEQQKIQTTQQIKPLETQPKNAQVQIQKSMKDTIIQIPKQFLQTSQVKQGQQVQEKQRFRPKIRKQLNIDNLMLLKQEVYKSLGNYEIWLQEYIDTQKKKIKYINGYRQQLIKCRETKTNDMNGNVYSQQKEEADQLSNQKQNSEDNNFQESKRDESNPKSLSQKDSSSKSYENDVQNQEPQKPQEYQKQKHQNNSSMNKQLTPFKRISIEQQSSSLNKSFPNQLFYPLVQSESEFRPRLFSAFSKSKSYQQHLQQNTFQKKLQRQNIVDQNIQIIHNLRQKQKNQVQGSI